MGLITAVLTAFYMSRQVFMTFFGRYRFADVRPEEIDAVKDQKKQLREAITSARLRLDSVRLIWRVP